MDLSIFVMKSGVFSTACLRDLFAICQFLGIIGPAHFVPACINNKTTSAGANPFQFRQVATEGPHIAIWSMSPPVAAQIPPPSVDDSHASLIATKLLRLPG